MRLVALALLVLAVSACVHKVTAAAAPVQPPHPVMWMIPLEADDDAQFCAQMPRDPWVDPSDTFPLRCVSVATIRAWLRVQRMAN